MKKNNKNGSVMDYFEEMCKIYRNSFNEKEISSYLEEFARGLNLDYFCDDLYNVIIRKEGTDGSSKNPVILQAHIDMVCVAEPEGYDWEKQAVVINNYEEDNIKKMRGGIKKEGAVGDKKEDYTYLTTLGADDGIGVAIAMSVLSSDKISHPPIIAIFTSQEESGMGGAGGLKLEDVQKAASGLDLSKASFINLDEEKYGRLCIGCAGGIRANLFLPYELEELPKNYESFELLIDGLQGGHSGLDIDKKRANAHRLMGRVLDGLLEKGIDVNFVRKIYSSNEKENAIPKSCKVIVAVPSKQSELFTKILVDIQEGLIDEYNHGYPEILEKISITATPTTEYSEEKAFTLDSLKKLICLLLTVPNDVLAMDLNIAGLVETSSNMGVFKHKGDGGQEFEVVECCLGRCQHERPVEVDVTNEQFKSGSPNELKFECAIRSSVEARKYFVLTQMRYFIQSLGGRLDIGSEYPGWTAKKDSDLQKIFVEAYKEVEQSGDDPQVWAAHAGLECGYFAQKFGNIDILSCGATVNDVHTINEILYTDTVDKTAGLLVRVLEKLSKVGCGV